MDSGRMYMSVIAPFHRASDLRILGKFEELRLFDLFVPLGPALLTIVRKVVDITIIHKK
jgi:hypothetical protein